jgi:KDO2-lipid IV(A) lauroyltransferase
MGRPINVVHRPLRNPRLDDLLTEIRARAGTGAIYKHAAARAVLRLLHQGALVAIPIDQHSPGASGVPIQFFGRPANTTLGPARLAQLTGVPLYVAVLARVGESTRHEIVVRPPVEPPPRGKDVGQLIATMQRVTSEFEVIVRERPEQWLWMHRRWRGP